MQMLGISLNTYACSAYFADGDSGSHFNCIEKAIIDFKLYKSVKFIFFSGLRSAGGVQCKKILRKLNKLYSTLFNHSYNTDVETNMLPFLYSFLSPSCWSDVAEDSTVNPLAAFNNLL